MRHPRSGDNAVRASILIVEDHDGVRSALHKWLADEFPGDRILDARTGEEAVDLAHAQRPDIVLMDISLPGMNGIEATRRIKAVVPEVSVIMLTIHEDPVYRTEATAAGASAYVSKGNMLATLIPAVSALLPLGKDQTLSASSTEESLAS